MAWKRDPIRVLACLCPSSEQAPSASLSGRHSLATRRRWGGVEKEGAGQGLPAAAAAAAADVAVVLKRGRGGEAAARLGFT